MFVNSGFGSGSVCGCVCSILVCRFSLFRFLSSCSGVRLLGLICLSVRCCVSVWLSRLNVIRFCIVSCIGWFCVCLLWVRLLGWCFVKMCLLKLGWCGLGIVLCFVLVDVVVVCCSIVRWWRVMVCSFCIMMVVLNISLFSLSFSLLWLILLFVRLVVLVMMFIGV